ERARRLAPRGSVALDERGELRIDLGELLFRRRPERETRNARQRRQLPLAPARGRGRVVGGPRSPWFHRVRDQGKQENHSEARHRGARTRGPAARQKTPQSRMRKSGNSPE